MTTTDEIEVTMDADRLEEFFDAWNAHDIDRIVSFFAPEGAYLGSIGPDDDGTAFRGLDEVRRGVTAFLGTYADAHYTDSAIVVAGDHGYATWTFHGTTADGARVIYRGVDIFKFAGDQILLKDAFRKERSTPIGG
jgi:ketosteroid isomerase-like protein